MILRRLDLFGLALVVVSAVATPASAETPAPWSVGVSDAQKAKAQQFLDAGNALFLDKKYAPALEQYKAAVGEWDHPAIRFNIVRCLIQLEKPVDAFDNLKLALKYDAAPLEEAVYTEALAYEKLLKNEISELTVSCTQAGVRLTLDGKALGTCPISEPRRVEPGAHLLVGTKDGFLTSTLEVFATGGKQQTVSVKLEPLATAARVDHRWPTWVPWVVFGSGFALAGIGGVLDLAAVADMNAYDQTVQTRCGAQACDKAALMDVQGNYDTARRNTTIAVSLMIAGGATVATGAVMLYLNRGRTVYPESRQRVTPSVTPLPGGAALTLGGAF